MRLIFAMTCLLATPATASSDRLEQIMASTQETFGEVATLQIVPHVIGFCGADQTVTSDAVYCTSKNIIAMTK